MSLPVIWIDFEDIFIHLETRARPSGIQRLAFEAAREMVAIAGPQRVRFVRHASGGSGFREVAFDTVRKGFAVATGREGVVKILRSLPDPAPEAPRAMRVAWRRVGALMPPEVRFAMLQVMLRLWDAAAAVPGVFRAVRHAWSRRRKEVSDSGGEAAPVRMARGDVLFALAAPWGSEHQARATAVCRDDGVRYVAMIYDMIPLVRPEFCVVQLERRFRAWITHMLPLCDPPLVISHATGRDVAAFARAEGIALRAPVRVVAIGSGFGGEGPALPAEPPLLPPGSYVLFVSTIEARKNHTLLFRVWRRMMTEMPMDQVPVLVFAGGIGWLVDDLMQQIRNSRFLDGKLAIVESPTDAALASLYRGAMFSVYPSHYEGWGLPVVESLSFGTPVVAARATSLPEAGGTLARYFADDDPADALRVIRGLIENPAELAAWHAEVRASFRPVSWQRTAREILDAIDGVEAAPACGQVDGVRLAV